MTSDDEKALELAWQLRKQFATKLKVSEFSYLNHDRIEGSISASEPSSDQSYAQLCQIVEFASSEGKLLVKIVRDLSERRPVTLQNCDVVLDADNAPETAMAQLVEGVLEKNRLWHEQSLINHHTDESHWARNYRNQHPETSWQQFKTRYPLPKHLEERADGKAAGLGR